MERGHNIYNFSARYTYYVLYPNREPSRVTPELILENWDPYVFDYDMPENNPAPLDMRVKGAGFCLWSDTPAAKTEDEILEDMRPFFTAIARKTVGQKQ